eukprot:gene25965-31355_t
MSDNESLFGGFLPSEGEVGDSSGMIPIAPKPIEKLEKLEIDRMNKLLQNVDNPAVLRYYKLVSSLAPNDMLLKFTKTAPSNVQEAVKSTVMNILGSLPNYVLDAALITTSSKLANLLYQMQMTGYMFKNAEYRMSLTKSLRGLPKLPPPAKVTPASTSTPISLPAASLETALGEVTVQVPGGERVAVDVQELTGALSNEVAALRKELMLIKSQRENELKSNLLTYIQALPEKELQRLTADMSSEVLQAIRLLVSAMMEKMGIDTTGPEMAVQQSLQQLAQLCIWQMVVGYQLRELEALDKGVSLD